MRLNIDEPRFACAAGFWPGCMIGSKKREWPVRIANSKVMDKQTHRRMPTSYQGRLTALKKAANRSQTHLAQPIPLSEDLKNDLNPLLQEYAPLVTQRKVKGDNWIVLQTTETHARKRVARAISYYLRVFQVMIEAGEFEPGERRKYLSLSETNGKLEIPAKRDEILPRARELVAAEARRMADGCQPMYNRCLDLLNDAISAHEQVSEVLLEATSAFGEVHDQIKAKLIEVDAFITKLWNTISFQTTDFEVGRRRAIAKEYGVVYVLRGGGNIDDFEEVDPNALGQSLPANGGEDELWNPNLDPGQITDDDVRLLELLRRAGIRIDGDGIDGLLNPNYDKEEGGDDETISPSAA